MKLQAVVFVLYGYKTWYLTLCKKHKLCLRTEWTEQGGRNTRL
jgi:hypothetical protein